MEMKTHQRRVIADLRRYLDILGNAPGLREAFCEFWQRQGVRLAAMPGMAGKMPPYQDILPGVPMVCAKVPTGGGKTFIACNAIAPIFSALPQPRKLVVWLVPSEAILSQTLAALKNPQHPYRQRLDVDFSSRVEVYSKEQLLAGQGFSAEDTAAQLSVCVLSYDSFRGRKENLKARRENSQLAPFARALDAEMGAPQMPLEDTDETALLQILNRLSPLVIVDESHHARSPLSLKMLREFNPCFVLELTATPRAESNIIAFSDALLLKNEGMIKLPVIVYNRNEMRQVLANAIDLQRALEAEAKKEQAAGGQYIRPIVLFQAQPKAKENSATFDKLREKLITGFGIDKTHIAIRTADINELKNVDLLSPACPIRYIITVNALKEGWDCPFAYILASLANRNSAVEVEQILGRVLRQPHARRSGASALNLSYVLTCSADFQAALDNIVKGLNDAGLSARDCRAAPEEETTPPQPLPKPEQMSLLPEEKEVVANDGEEEEAFLAFEPNDVAESSPSEAQRMLQAAEEQNRNYEEAARQRQEEEAAQGLPDSAPHLPEEWKANMPIYHVLPKFAQELESLRLPQFMCFTQPTLFNESGKEPLERELLSEGFTLLRKSTEVDFDEVDAELVEIDVREGEGDAPRAEKLALAAQRKLHAFLSTQPPEHRLRLCKEIIHGQLDRMDGVKSNELRTYVDRVVEDMDEKHLPNLERAPLAYAEKIKHAIERLMVEHGQKQFDFWVQTGKIRCEEHYRLPAAINTVQEVSSAIAHSLYEAEGKMNALESELARTLSGMDNVRWWHRNLENKGFRINGFINHYPDFIIRMKSGAVVLAETKGAQLKNNDDSIRKVQLGKAWQNAAGHGWHYFMVFENEPMTDAVDMQNFCRIVREL